MRFPFLCSALILAIFTAACVEDAAESNNNAAESKYVDLQVGITGSNDSEGLDNPVEVLQHEKVSHLMQDMADAPRDAQFIADALRGSEVDLDRLVALRLIREVNGEYVIDFPYLTVEDHDRLIRLLDPYAEELANAYLKKRDEFEQIFSDYDVASVPDTALAYAIIGAFSLDWDGLTITAREGYRTTAENMPQGLDYIPWAKETVSQDSLKGLYWGSHNAEIPGAQFTTFGDHAPRNRRGIPDLLWRYASVIYNADKEEPEVSKAVYFAFEPYLSDEFLGDLWGVLAALRGGASTLAEIAKETGLDEDKTERLAALLEELDYIESNENGFRLVAPVLTQPDRAMLRKARDLSNRIIIDFLDARYDSAKADLGELTVMKYGVPYENLYTEIWHYLFGLTNRKLAEKGFMLDPYDEARRYEGFAPFVFDVNIYDQETILFDAP